MVQKRKLQELGGSLFVSLPQKWIKKFNLKKGAEIALVPKSNGEIILAPTAPQSPEKTTSIINFSKYFYRELIREYLYATDRVVIQKKESFSKKERSQVLTAVNRLMNSEVIEETKNKIIIQNFKTTDIPLKTLIKRMYFLTKTMLEDLIEAQSKDKNVLESIIERDKMVGRFYLNIIMHIRAMLTGRMFTGEFRLIDLLDLRLLIERIEIIGDEIKEIAREKLNKKKFNQTDLKFLHQRYEVAFKSYIEQDVKKASEFWSTEEDDKKKINKNMHLSRLYDAIKDITDLVI